MQQSSLPRDALIARTVIRRLDDWNGVVNGSFENLTIDASRDGFEGVLDARRFGDLDLSRVASSAAVVRRARPGGGSADHKRYFKLHLQDLGSSLNIQDGHEAVLRPGDLMLCDSSRPYSIRFDDPNRMLVLRLPEARVVARLGDPDAIVGRRLGVEGLGASMLSAFVRSFTPGRFTTIVLPWRCTSGSAIPRPSTRLRMTVTAVFSELRSVPFTGNSTIEMPPWRSSPSTGRLLESIVAVKTPTMKTTVTISMMTRRRTVQPASEASPDASRLSSCSVRT